MAAENSTRPIPAVSPDPVLPIAAKCSRALALLEEAWELIHEVLEEADWHAQIPACFPEEALEPLRQVILLMRPAQNFPAGTTRAELEAAAEAEGASRH